jgi:hypothetical protein
MQVNTVIDHLNEENNMLSAVANPVSPTTSAACTQVTQSDKSTVWGKSIDQLDTRAQSHIESNGLEEVLVGHTLQCIHSTISFINLLFYRTRSR